jgi:hypothetical protein
MMDEKNLREICPAPKFLGVAYYGSRRWIINSSCVASILPRRDHRVYGTVWRLHEVELAALDMHYGLPQRFDRYASLATLLDGRRCTSEFYSARDRNPGPATQEYLDHIIKIGRQLGFPEGYLEELSCWTTPQDISIRASLRAKA